MEKYESYLEDFQELLLQENEKPIIELLASSPNEMLALLYTKLAAHISTCIKQDDDIDYIILQTSKFRPVLNFAIGQLIALYQTQDEMISKKNAAIAEACKQVFVMQYKSYAIVLDHLRHREDKQGLLAITIHRIMLMQLFIFLISYLKYDAIADKEWLNLHRLFAIANHNHVMDFTVSDENFDIINSTSISELYRYCLLMGCAKLYSLKINSILNAFHFIVEKGNLVTISTNSVNPEDEIVVDITSGLAPIFAIFLFLPNNRFFISSLYKNVRCHQKTQHRSRAF